MKTRTPIKNKKSIRRLRVIKKLEARLKLGDKELASTAKRFKNSQAEASEVKAYRSDLEQHLKSLREIQNKKGGPQ